MAVEHDIADKGGRPLERTQEALARCFSSLLEIESVGLKDNFFELGANSIQMAMFVNRIREEFNVEIPILAVFQTPTIEAIALAVRDLQ